MARKKNENRINLLPQEEFDASTLGRTLKWVLTTFRYIVILTEIIVMISFLSRFWLDAQSGDLIDAINQKKAIIATYSTFENQFRSTQNRLKIFSEYALDAQKITPAIGDIASKIPTDVTLNEISITGSQITITSKTQNEVSASGFVKT